MNSVWDKTPEEVTLPDHKLNYKLRNMASIYEEDGFEIPVKMDCYYPDTVVQVAGVLNEETKKNESWIREHENDSIDNRHWYNTWRISYKNWERRVLVNYDTIYKIDTLITRTIFSKWSPNYNRWHGENVDEAFKNNILNLTQNHFQPQVESSVYVKPKRKSHFFLLLVRDNLKILFLIFIFYQLWKMVISLKTTFSFNKNIYGRIKMIGVAVVIFSLLKFLFDYLLTHIYHFIGIESTSSYINYIHNDFVFYMYAHYEFSFEAFSVGLLLIVFSTLMKRSSEIEKNWSLTI